VESEMMMMMMMMMMMIIIIYFVPGCKKLQLDMSTNNSFTEKKTN
jgi:hypothetical protein